MSAANPGGELSLREPEMSPEKTKRLDSTLNPAFLQKPYTYLETAEVLTRDDEGSNHLCSVKVAAVVI